MISQLQEGNQCTFTFDARQAMINRTLEFLTIHHPIVRAAFLDLVSSDQLLPPGLRTRIGEGPPGCYLFFVYEVASRALPAEVELIAAVVDEKGEMVPTLSKEFMSLARRAESLEARNGAAHGTGDPWILDTAVDAAEAAQGPGRDSKSPSGRPNSSV